MVGCGVVLLALLACAVHSDLTAAEVRHPMDDDIPADWW
jgi:hypothetical protein